MRLLWGAIKRRWSNWRAAKSNWGARITPQWSCSVLTGLLLTASVTLLAYQRDAWRGARASGRQIAAAEFRAKSARALVADKERLYWIAVRGIQTPDDERLARQAAAVIAADICLGEQQP